jgi:hypothetical protein|tara:strand:+ start:2470 stop:2769 length:300 start_codon:yes stop_codon:yes gene_type:complete
MTIVEAINQYGFPIIAACGLGYFVYYIWTWATKQIDPVVGEAQATLIALIDRIRMLDNDLIRLNQKLNMIIELKEKEIEGNETENRVLDDSKNEKSNTE